jgi:hypothetical protein
MIYGLNNNDKFYVEYTACERPIGTVRQELEAACRRLANEGQVLISLSGGLDSQVLVHTFHTLKLPFEAAFLYHPGVNDVEFQQVLYLEKKYNFKCIVVTMDPYKEQDRWTQLAVDSGIPPEHHMMKDFVSQLPDDRDILQGIDGPDLIVVNGKCYCLEAWNTIALARIRALEQLDRKGKIVTVDRRAPFNEFALAYLSDPVVDSYLSAFSYLQGSSLVEKETGETPIMTVMWEHYAKPIIFGMHWKNELEYFPKFASQWKIDWIYNPVDARMRHSYRQQRVLIERNTLITHLSQWGTNNIRRWTEQ